MNAMASVGRHRARQLLSVLVVAGLSLGQALAAPSAAPTGAFKLEGTWTIVKVPDPGTTAHLPVQFAPEQERGKTLHFIGKGFRYASPFLFFPDTCRDPGYERITRAIGEYEVTGEGSLNKLVPFETPGGLGPRSEHQENFVTLKCSGKPIARADMSRSGDLAVYWQSGFFYLKKVH